MRAQRSLITLTVLNLALLVFSVAQRLHPAIAENQSSVLRGRGLQIVDAQGRIRASISVLTPDKSADATGQSETVLLRLITERGRPTVKIGASEETSGLMFAGPTNTKDTYAILKAKESTTQLKLRNEDGRQQVVSP